LIGAGITLLLIAVIAILWIRYKHVEFKARIY
jgi:hypothetical protein